MPLVRRPEPSLHLPNRTQLRLQVQGVERSCIVVGRVLGARGMLLVHILHPSTLPLSVTLSRISREYWATYCFELRARLTSRCTSELKLNANLFVSHYG